ncbi:hypothetical protein AQUCO_01100176v1, partial [Aquilegia coerulea]
TIHIITTKSPIPLPPFSFLADKCSSMRELKQIHAQLIVSARIHDNYAASRILNFCALSRCYSVSGNIVLARRVFDEIPERNLIIWTSMISGYAQNFCSDEALVLFDQMRGEGVEPNSVTLASVLSSCARSSCLDLGQQIHLFMKEKDIEVGLILGTALVDMYAKNGAISMARRLFDNMPERNIATWNAMICGLAHHGHAEGALELFRELRREELVPNDITFVGVLSACCHSGLIDFGCNIFQSMKGEYGVEPKIEHYGCMIDILGRSGRLLEAEELLSSMVWKADVVVLGALLGACKNHGNIEIAERVVKKILNLDPYNHGVYVVLSNMYAEAGRWEDVVNLRKSMKDGDLKKLPGWSVVNGGG